MTSDLDPSIKTALNHLHSTQLSSAADIRVLLDSLIKKQHGTSKMLINRLSKKQLDEEENSPGVMATLPEPLEILDSPPPQPEPIDDPENDDLQIDEGEPEPEDIAMNEDFNDLNCIICDSMMYSATNRLMECAECHSLYHQQCHTPNIEDDLVQDSWVCSNCKEKLAQSKTPIPEVSTSFLTKSSSSSSAPSSASSSPYHKSAEVPPSKTGSSKSSSSSSSLKEDSKSGSKLSVTNPPSRSEKSSSSSGKKHKSGSSSSKSSSSKDHDKKSKKSK
ncbi:INTS12 family protein [Megaselia abdita]